MSKLGLTLYTIAIFHLQLWTFIPIQQAVTIQMDKGYVAGWTKNRRSK